MFHTAQNLYDNLANLLLEINKQIDSVKVETVKKIQAQPYPDLVTVYDMREQSGRPVLADLLVAKAQVLSGMAALKTADGPSKPPAAGRKW